MPGVKGLRRIQLGQEVTPGTGVATTAIWRGTGTPQDELEVVYVPEDIGLAVPTDRTHIAKLGALFTFDETPATYEQIMYPMEAGIKTQITGVSDSGSGFIYTYPFPTTAANTIKTFTLEGGDNQQEEEMAYCFVESLSLSGEQGGALMVTSNWRGRQLAASTFTAAPTLPTVEDILFSKGILGIDVVGAAYGNTPKSNTLLAMNFNLTTGFVASDPGDGQLYFMFHKYAPTVFNGDLSVTFEHDDTSVAEKAAWRAQTARKLQFKFTGSTLTSGGTYTVKTLLINLTGKWTTFAKIDERNGNDIVTGTFQVRYNATVAGAGSIIVVNEVAAVT